MKWAKQIALPNQIQIVYYLDMEGTYEIKLTIELVSEKLTFKAAHERYINSEDVNPNKM